MGRRTTVLFWGSVAAAVMFLGSAWTAAGRIGSGPADVAVFAISVAGLLVTAFVAGRIALVVARFQRASRARSAGSSRL